VIAPSGALVRLQAILREAKKVAVAVSGGVDSLTLAAAAHATEGLEASMFHAVSPAVPAAATARVRQMARDHGWHLTVVDAGEFDDPAYMSNPVDRCFHCKRNLYDAVIPHTNNLVVSGTNLDDLDDYRPGLTAAANARVRHPFVEAQIDKTIVRELAAELGLGAVAELAAAPCLSSRIETGIAIDAVWLALIDEIEVDLRDRLRPETVRCRVRSDRIVVELDRAAFTAVSVETGASLVAELSSRWAAIGVERRVTIEPYRMGSAFLKVMA
jgi:uncharacterized protein